MNSDINLTINRTKLMIFCYMCSILLKFRCRLNQRALFHMDEDTGQYDNTEEVGPDENGVMVYVLLF